MNAITFECRLYVSGRDKLAFALPKEGGPQKVARLAAPGYDQLIDPAFRRLLAAFESLPESFIHTAPIGS